MKKALIIFFSISLVFISSLISFQSASAQSIDTNNSNTQQKISMNDFLSYLHEQTESDDLQVQQIAENNLGTFLNLSEAEKTEFLATLNDPQKLENNLTLTETTDSDINDTPQKATITATRKNVGYNFDYTYLGINVYGLHIDVTYTVSGGAVKEVLESDAYVRYSYNPVVHLSLISKTQYISADKQAYARAKFSYNIGPISDLGAQIGIKAISVAGDGNGNRSYHNAWNE